MPRLADISYSRDATIAAHHRAPAGGWPQISQANLGHLGKTDEVVELLRHLPYIRDDGEADTPQAAPGTRFVDWARLAARNLDAESARLATDGDEWEHVPAHVVGLAREGRSSFSFNLDTELGVVYWIKCPNQLRGAPRVEPVLDDPADYAPEAELAWRADGPGWAVSDLFEQLRGEFRELSFVPVGPKEVIDDYSNHSGESGDGSTAALREVYRSHGWPDLDKYKKEDCLEAVRNTLQENYPDLLEEDSDEEDDE
ncbi:uncharacterized protein PG998_010218 [Apiospora kogelbergensis]|uniref:uncharacterized protein n=1 Tax=Apiospora kogelbergensis TaxID=1337665 RepID=UPI003131290F